MDRTVALEIPPRLSAQVEDFAEEVGLTFEVAARVLMFLGKRAADNPSPVSLAEFLD